MIIVWKIHNPGENIKEQIGLLIKQTEFGSLRNSESGRFVLGALSFGLSSTHLTGYNKYKGTYTRMIIEGGIVHKPFMLNTI